MFPPLYHSYDDMPVGAVKSALVPSHIAFPEVLETVAAGFAETVTFTVPEDTEQPAPEVFIVAL